LFTSSSGSCHDGDAIWQEINHMCGSSVRNVIGETGRKFGTRLKEHKKEVEAICSKPFTRKQRATSLSEQNKSALTDHASHHNHVINWSAATILDRESGQKY